MKKYYPIITIILLIAVIAVLCFFKGTTNTSTANNSLAKNVNSETVTTSVSAGEKIFNLSELFTDRDLAQTADLANATKYEVTDGENITINKEGVYVISGEAQNVKLTGSFFDWKIKINFYRDREKWLAFLCFYFLGSVFVQYSIII